MTFPKGNAVVVGIASQQATTLEFGYFHNYVVQVSGSQQICYLPVRTDALLAAGIKRKSVIALALDLAPQPGSRVLGAKGNKWFVKYFHEVRAAAQSHLYVVRDNGDAAVAVVRILGVIVGVWTPE